MSRLMISALSLLVTGTVTGEIRAETFDSDGVEIFYSVHGQGDPLVLIHGYTMSGETNFGAPGVIESLASNYRVILIDARGHGASGKPHASDAYGMNMVNDVVNLMDHLGIEKAHVGGYSMGGMITQKLMTEHPERVNKAIIGGAGWSDQADFSFNDMLADAIETEHSLGPLIVALTPAGQPLPSSEEIQAIDAALLATNDAAALAAVARGFTGLMKVSEDELSANSVPVLYVVGELDPLKEAVDHAKSAVSNAEFVYVPGSDHMAAFSHPMFVRSILEFLGED